MSVPSSNDSILSVRGLTKVFYSGCSGVRPRLLSKTCGLK